MNTKTGSGRRRRWRSCPGGSSRRRATGPPCAPPGLDRRRQRARPQHDGQVACLRRGEAAGDLGAPGRDALADLRGRVDVAVEDDGEPPPDVLLGQVAEGLAAGRVELDRDLQCSLVFWIDLRPARWPARGRSVAPSSGRRTGTLRSGLRLLVHPPLVEDLVAVGHAGRPAPARASPLSSTSLNSRSAVLPMSALARSGSCTPGQLDQDAVRRPAAGWSARRRRTGPPGCGSSPAPWRTA